jgi:hypothetical protein
MHKKFGGRVVVLAFTRSEKAAGSARIARTTASTRSLSAAGRARQTRFHLDAADPRRDPTAVAAVDGTNRKRL